MDEKVKEAMNGIFNKFTDDQKEQAKTCKNMDEFMKLAGEWGIELPDELLYNVAGGRRGFGDIRDFFNQPIMDGPRGVA